MNGTFFLGAVAAVVALVSLTSVMWRRPGGIIERVAFTVLMLGVLVLLAVVMFTAYVLIYQSSR